MNQSARQPGMSAPVAVSASPSASAGIDAATELRTRLREPWLTIVKDSDSAAPPGLSVAPALAPSVTPQPPVVRAGAFRAPSAVAERTSAAAVLAARAAKACQDRIMAPPTLSMLWGAP